MKGDRILRKIAKFKFANRKLRKLRNKRLQIFTFSEIAELKNEKYSPAYVAQIVSSRVTPLRTNVSL